MTSRYVGSNKGSSTVAVGFNATATTFSVATGEGARFPSPTGGDYTLVVLQNAAGVREIVCVVGRSGDTMTVGIPGSAAANVLGRNYESIYGMAAAAWVAGDVVACRPTAALMERAANSTTAAELASAVAASAATLQPLDADLTAIAALTSAADKVPYATGAGAWALATLTAFGRSLIAAVDAAAAKVLLGLTIGTDVQAYDAQLSSLVRRNAQNAGYTCVLTDGGKHISMSSAGVFTIPANASVAYPIGTPITFYNPSASSTIAITSDTMVLAGIGTTGTRTLAQYGVATALKVSATTWVISGSGLT